LEIKKERGEKKEKIFWSPVDVAGKEEGNRNHRVFVGRLCLEQALHGRQGKRFSSSGQKKKSGKKGHIILTNVKGGFWILAEERMVR